MQEISFNDGVETVLDSLLSDRLVLLAGAGLSMAPPSSLPSAATLAALAKKEYDAMYGAARAPLPAGVEDQAEFFFQRGELETVYFRKLISQHAFAGQPNSGHFAAADLLLVGAIQTAITTNVDTLIETAGNLLFGQIGSGIDRNHVAALPPTISPLLKIHGCRSVPESMVWAPGQLGVPPVSERISTSATWLNHRLLDRDLLIIGYWSDWDYLNGVLSATLGAVTPARVTVVDPSDRATFVAKAPNLYELGQRASSAFQHVRASGADFLDSLRGKFSKSFLRRVLHSGVAEYSQSYGSEPDAAWLEPSITDSSTLWQIRRDLEGCLPNEPATNRSPPNEPLVGLTLLQLQAGGAVADGPCWSLDGRQVRVLRAANKPLHRVEAEFARETPPTVAPNMVIAVGAEASALPMNIARRETQPTVARGSSSRWLTRAEAVQELGL